MSLEIFEPEPHRPSVPTGETGWGAKGGLDRSNFGPCLGRQFAEGTAPYGCPVHRAKRLDVPPVYFLASAALMLLLHLGLPGPQLVHCTWRWLGLLPVVVGVALAVAGERAFNLKSRSPWRLDARDAGGQQLRCVDGTGTLPTPISRIRQRTSLTSGM